MKRFEKIKNVLNFFGRKRQAAQKVKEKSEKLAEYLTTPEAKKAYEEFVEALKGIKIR